MLSFRPVSGRLRQRLRPLDLADVAIRTIVLDEGKHWNASPLIMLPDTLDRMIGHHPDSTPERNRQQIECRDVFQGPTTAFLVKDALIADGTVMTPGWVHPVRVQRRRPLVWEDAERLTEAALCSTAVSERYFGHWLRDQLPSEILARAQGVEPLALAGTVRPNEPEYRRMTGLPAHMVTTARVERLWLYHDFEITPHRVARIEELRARIRNAVEPGGPERVFMGRGPSAVGRTLANEAKLAEALEREGFAYVVPETMGSAEIAWTLRDAKVVIAPEGSANAHALCAMPRGATLFQIIPPRQFNLVYRIYSEAVGLRNAIDIGDDMDEGRFTMPLDRIMRMLDLIDSETA